MGRVPGADPYGRSLMAPSLMRVWMVWGSLARPGTVQREASKGRFVCRPHIGGRECWVNRARHGASMDSHHPPPRNLSLLLSRINRGLTQAPAGSLSQSAYLGAGW